MPESRLAASMDVLEHIVLSGKRGNNREQFAYMAEILSKLANKFDDNTP